MRAVFTCVMLVAMLPAFAQKSSKLRKKLYDADDKLEVRDYLNALDIYTEVWDEDSSNAEVAYNIGKCLYNVRSRRMESLYWFEKAEKMGARKSSYYLGTLYHLLFRFDDALAAYNRYSQIPDKARDHSLAEIDRMKYTSITATEMIKYPVSAVVDNLGPSINSQASDYSPLIANNGASLIFTSRRKGGTGGQVDAYREYYEDIYISHKQGGEWTRPMSISPNINTETHDATVALSPSERVLFFYRTDHGLTGGDIYTSQFTGSEWSEPKIMEEQVNTAGGVESSASISPDSTVFYFSSNMPGGFGGRDIYRVVKLPNGNWSKALNLGPTVNTPYDDDSPFIHGEGKVLYFSSKGHTNMGGFDIFRTILNEDGTWTQPENLGYPVNSVDDDIYLVLSKDGTNGYFSSARSNGFGQTDIYSIKLTPLQMEFSVVRGNVVSNESGTAVPARITLIDDDSRVVQGIYNVSNRGKYLMIICPDKRYKVVVEAEGYYPYTDQLLFVPGGNNEMEQDIKLTKKQ
jgi:tetratricopeptide (TPR) repeat protein